MIGTFDGYWYSLVEHVGNTTTLEIMHYGVTVTEEFLTPNDAVLDVFDDYVAAYRRSPR